MTTKPGQDQLREKPKSGGLPRRRRLPLIALVVGVDLVRDLFLHVVLPALVWVHAGEGYPVFATRSLGSSTSG